MSLRRVLPFALALLLPALALGQDDAAAVRSTFAAYRSAILESKGREAAALLSRSTLAYFEDMRTLALTGDARAVQAQMLVNQMQILLLRLRVPTDKLESLPPEGLIAYAVDQGWIGRKSVEKLTPGDVLQEGDLATLQVNVEGAEKLGLTPGFRFRRESGQWRLDLVPTLQLSNVALQMVAKQKKVPEDQFMLGLVASVVGQEVGPEAWVPPRPAPKKARK